MTIITIKTRAVFVGTRCIEDDARTRDDALSLAASVEAGLQAAGQECKIVFAKEA